MLKPGDIVIWTERNGTLIEGESYIVESVNDFYFTLKDDNSGFWMDDTDFDGGCFKRP